MALDVDAMRGAARRAAASRRRRPRRAAGAGGATTRTTSPPSATTIEVARGRASGPSARPAARERHARVRPLGEAVGLAPPPRRRMPARAPVLLGVRGRAVEGERVRPADPAARDARAEQVRMPVLAEARDRLRGPDPAERAARAATDVGRRTRRRGARRGRGRPAGRSSRASSTGRPSSPSRRSPRPARATVTRSTIASRTRPPGCAAIASIPHVPPAASRLTATSTTTTTPPARLA